MRKVEWRVGPMCRADCSQWWQAKFCVQPGRPKSVFAPRGALWAAMSGTVAPGHHPGHGLPRRPCTTLLPSPQR